MSALPSPSASVAATLTPPAKSCRNAISDPRREPVLPSNTLTCELPPGPAPVMMSANPSPFTSPTATVTPPAKVGL